MNVDEDNPFARLPPWVLHARALSVGSVGSLALLLMLRGGVGRGDVLSALLIQRDPTLALGVVALFCARAFLLFVAPGWALFAGFLFYQARKRHHT